MLYNYFSVLFVFEALFAGVSGGKVVCAFQPSKCEIMEEGSEKGRERFGCTEAPLKILGKITKCRRKVLKKFRQGSAVAYLSLSELNSILKNNEIFSNIVDFKGNKV